MLWDKDFASGDSRFKRIRRFLAEWIGWIGLSSIAGLLLIWVAFSPYGIHPRSGYWLIPEVTIPAAMLVFRGVVRKIGLGILVALASPLWPYLALGGIAILGPPIVVYLISIWISNAAVSVRTKH